MTNGKIIEMANQNRVVAIYDKQDITAFARLIEAATREECAKLIEDRLLVAFGKGAADYNEGVNDCAAAIRESGK